MEGKDSMSAKSERAEIKAVPDPEVTEKAGRRKFTAAYKARILKEAELCTQPGELGALLRREGFTIHQSGNGNARQKTASAPRNEDPRNPIPLSA